MNPIEKRLVKVEKIRNGIKNIIREEAIKQRDFIAQLNRDQLLAGKRADGRDMPEYAASSQKSGKITLFDEGDFHAGIDAVFEDDFFNVVGTDFKTGFLIAKFEESLGLNKESLNRLRSRMLPNIIKRIKELS